MHKKPIIIFSLILAIIFVGIGISKNEKLSDTESFNSVNEALNAGIDETMTIYNVSGKTDKYNQSVFEYKDGQDIYFVNEVILDGDADITHSENLYVIKITPKDKKYLFERASALFAVKQINEKGEVNHPTWTVPIKKNLTFIVGKVENPQQQNVYAGEEKVEFNKDGFFVYVYKGKGEPPELIFEP